MIKAILLDIEGTTTPIDFVHKTLFPYAKSRVGEFVENHFAELSNEIDQLKEEKSQDDTSENSLEPSDPTSISTYLEHLIDADRKSTPLKSIQGMIWKEGYESGELRSIVFEDVRPALERWTSKGIKIAIFSSGSVLAQQLLFRYTDHGDLTPFISNYFDTYIGPKREVKSYQNIAGELNSDPNNILFLSDIVEELDTARSAGLETALVVREGNAVASEPYEHKIISTFADVSI
jgi:enolase-phosphatase E1